MVHHVTATFPVILVVCKWLLSLYMCREILSVCNLQVMQSKDHFVIVWPTEKWLCTSSYSSWIQYMDIICGEPILLWSVKLLTPQFTSSKNPGTHSCKTISPWQTWYALSLILIRIYPYSPSLYIRTLVDVLLKRVIWISTTDWFVEPVHKFGNLVIGTFLSVLLLHLQEISRCLIEHTHRYPMSGCGGLLHSKVDLDLYPSSTFHFQDQCSIPPEAVCPMNSFICHL